MSDARRIRKGFTRITAKHQATIPVRALEESGLKPGDEVRVVAVGPGRVVVERYVDVAGRHAGSLRGVFTLGELDKLRDEWR